MNDIMTEEPRLNEWIWPEQKAFGYNLFWPYGTPLNPEKESIDVYVALTENRDKQYIGTFTTLAKIEHIFSLAERSGEFASGSYVRLSDGEIILKRITNSAIERTIDDLIEQERLIDLFTEADGNVPYE